MSTLAVTCNMPRKLRVPDPEKLIGKRVIHVLFGRGRITGVRGGCIVADIDGVERMFEYPAAFGTYLTIADKKLRTALPPCDPITREMPSKPAGRRMSNFIHDEYDTVILADTVHCTI